MVTQTVTQEIYAPIPEGAKPIPPVPPPDKWDYDVDVLIVGSGIGGLMAAMGAIEEGIYGNRIMIIEKADYVGGESRHAWFACPAGGKSWSKAFGKPWDEDAKKRIFDLTMQLNNYKLDPKLLWKFIEWSANGIDKLEELGVKIQFIELPPSPPTITSYTPYAAMALALREKDYSKYPGTIGHCGIYTTAAEKFLKENNVTTLLETPAMNLVMDNGVVVGVRAKTREGKIIHIKAKRVILSTGGFNYNLDMCKYYGGLPALQGSTLCPPTKTGDGIRMSQGVGADISDMHNIEGAEGGIDGLQFGCLTQSLQQAAVSLARTPSLMVNKFAERFCNEDAMYGIVVLHLARQPDGLAFTIFDSTMIHKEEIMEKFKTTVCEAPDPSPYVWLDEDHVVPVEQHPPIIYNHPELGFYEPYEDSLKRNIEEGKIIVANTIEELAEKLGLDSQKLKKTIEEYNEICRTKKDPFGKRPELLHPIEVPPFYAVKHKLMTWDTPGG